MPLWLEGDFSGHELFSSAKWNSNDRLREPDAHSIHIGLINNMPDGALQATERQFATLLDSAAGDIVVRLSLYALPEVPRTDLGRRHIRRFYSDIQSLWSHRLDGLIVTGAEPAASRLTDEPYWNSLTKVIDWAEQNTCSSIWSCLAAHAAVLHLDGIERRRLEEKRFGLFECSPVSDHPMTCGAPALFMMPHSRWNDLPESELKDCGYQILARAEDGCVDSFVKQRNSLLVFFQGHPEYEAETLLLEYRRDVGRYLRGERDSYPKMPDAYFDKEAQAVLEGTRRLACSNDSEKVFANLSVPLVDKRAGTVWKSPATQIYRNWLAYLSLRSEQPIRQVVGSCSDNRLEDCASPLC